MTTDAHDEPNEQDLAALGELLARVEVWDDPPPGLEDLVVATISAAGASSDTAAMAPPVPLRPRRRTTFWLAAAAAAVVVVAGIGIATRGGGPGGVEIALAPPEATSGASATANLSATPAGLKILLDVDGLPGAPEDAFYEAWVSDGTTRVSAGTFHLRNGDGEIELWAGVVDPRFDRLAITLEPLDGVAESSGDVVLAGRFELDG